MDTTTSVIRMACERAFVRVCAVGVGVEGGTPAAGFLAAAAHRIDEALARLPGPSGSERARGALEDARDLLDRVEQLAGREPVDGLDDLAVLIDGVCVTLDAVDVPPPSRQPAD